MGGRGCQNESLKDGNNISRVPQEEMLIFWEVIILVILSKIVYIYTYPIANGFRYRTISQ